MTVISGIFFHTFEKAVIGNFSKNIISFTNKSTQILDDFTKKCKYRKRR